MSELHAHCIWEEKPAILKRVLGDKVPVSDLRDEKQLHPPMLYRWQKSLFQNAVAALQRPCSRPEEGKLRKIVVPRTRVQQKNVVAGLRCHFTHNVAVKYFLPVTLGELFHQTLGYGQGRIRLMRKHPGTIFIGSLLPGAFVLGLIVGLPLSFLAPWLAVIYAGTLFLYLAIILLSSLQIALRLGNPRLLPWLPLAFMTIHVGSGVGILCELVVGPKHRCG
ncbi:unnamed protein product [marine sediment metagenome]|uniref:Uncharacterized protein n=1 Tax=marine sediment metagenome TaxID=412755 RepID=X0X883_9ZZZZ